eukprot:6704295-Prymnesium_polylepis.1
MQCILCGPRDRVLLQLNFGAEALATVFYLWGYCKSSLSSKLFSNCGRLFDCSMPPPRPGLGNF